MSISILHIPGSCIFMKRRGIQVGPILQNISNCQGDNRQKDTKTGLKMWYRAFKRITFLQTNNEDESKYLFSFFFPVKRYFNMELVSTRCTSRRAESQNARKVSCQLAWLITWSVIIPSAVRSVNLGINLISQSFLIHFLHTSEIHMRLSKRILPASILIVDLIESCFPSNAFSMYISKGTQQVEGPNPDLQ